MKGTVKVWEHLSDLGDSADKLCYISTKMLQFFTDLPHLQIYYRRNSWCKGKKETMALPSSPKPLLEERINLMQTELDRIKGLVKKQTNLMLSLDTIGANCWDSINQELKALREDVAKEVEVNFKDIANVIGGMHHQISKLEAKVEELSKAWPSTSKAQASSDNE